MISSQKNELLRERERESGLEMQVIGDNWGIEVQLKTGFPCI